MKINRNYRFVLTCVPAEDFNQETAQDFNQETAQENRTGEFMFESECHYYVEKEILSRMKDAAKRNALDEYRNHVYLIWKETKPQTIKETREEDGKKVTIEQELPTVATLIETIRLNGDDVEIR